MRPSPLANRVSAFGICEAVDARGMMFGNRGGRFHDPASQRIPGRPWASQQWICCVLSFKGRQRQVWGKGYTELFFCDEVTALAAGHRPCFECRRADATAFARAVQAGLGLDAPPRAPAMDLIVHAERLDGRAKRLHRREIATLPDGAMFAEGSIAFALRGGRKLLWSHEGYRDAGPKPAAGTSVDCLTPPMMLAALAAGYQPRWHASAKADPSSTPSA